MSKLAGFRYLWIVETKAGKLKYAITRGKKGPLPDTDGFLHFSFDTKRSYGVNPRVFRDFTFKPSKFSRKRFYRVQFWKENDSKPLDFFHVQHPDPKFTAEMITTAMRAKKIREVIPREEFDIVKVALLLSLMANIAVIAWLISQVKVQ